MCRAICGRLRAASSQQLSVPSHVGLAAAISRWRRNIARLFRHLSLREIVKLLHSPIHEDRFTALKILVAQYEAGDAAQRVRVFRTYLQHTDRINNWDLVDTSARYIVGEHLRHRSRKRLYRLARSRNLWERRIAMLSTHAWIGAGDTEDAAGVRGCSGTDRPRRIGRDRS
jgi:3-methyladenine DNA glycosylase AlkD